jgi:hypothetical protein
MTRKQDFEWPFMHVLHLTPKEPLGTRTPTRDPSLGVAGEDGVIGHLDNRLEKRPWRRIERYHSLLCVAMSTHYDPPAFLERVVWGDPLARHRPQEYVASAACAPPAQDFSLHNAGNGAT